MLKKHLCYEAVSLSLESRPKISEALSLTHKDSRSPRGPLPCSAVAVGLHPRLSRGLMPCISCFMLQLEGSSVGKCSPASSKTIAIRGLLEFALVEEGLVCEGRAEITRYIECHRVLIKNCSSEVSLCLYLQICSVLN